MTDIIDFTNCELSSRNLSYAGRAGEKRSACSSSLPEKKESRTAGNRRRRRAAGGKTGKGRGGRAGLLRRVRKDISEIKDEKVPHVRCCSLSEMQKDARVQRDRGRGKSGVR